MAILFLTYFIPIILIAIPLYLIYRIWTHNFEIKAAWMSYFAHALLFLVTLFIVGRWSVVGYSLRYWLYGSYFVVLICSYVRVTDLPFYEKEKKWWRWGQLLEIGLFLGALVWTIAGLNPESKTVDVEEPLKGNGYTVFHGGETPIINYHGAFAKPQTYAMDIIRTNDWGFRAQGLLPEKPTQYAIFGDTVYSPVTGVVVKRADSLKDQRIPNMRPEAPTGNHIWIKSDSLYIVLAHLKQNSIRVEEGEQVRANQPVAQVGNTGNTSEPHLHMHAVKYPAKNPPPADSLLYGGKPVPVTFDGKFLIRNDTF